MPWPAPVTMTTGPSTLKSRADAGTPESWGVWVKGVVVIVDPRGVVNGRGEAVRAVLTQSSLNPLEFYGTAVPLPALDNIPQYGILSTSGGSAPLANGRAGRCTPSAVAGGGVRFVKEQRCA